ncbi:MAG: CHAP domain-containing protein [Eubacterium sp.]|nr:CHAP domain-containing protein [Eubacterium sp.]
MKKIISLLLALITITTIIVTSGTTAFAYTAHNEKEAVDWAEYRGNNKIKVGDGQCVALIRAYYEYLGVPCPGGNGNEYATNTLPNGWKRYPYTSGFVAKPGDIAVWTYNKWAGSYGHVAIVTSANASTMNYVDQGKTYGYKCHNGSLAYSAKDWTFYGVIRPDFVPFTLTDFQNATLTPNNAKISYKISNPNVIAIEKRAYAFKKHSAEKWSGNVVKYSTPVKNSIKCGLSLTSLAESTVYDLRFSAYANGQWHHMYASFTTPAKTSIAGTSVPNTKVKYTGSNISTASLLNVTVDGKKLAAGNDYTVSPSTVKDIGRHKVTITGKNWYKDSVTTYVTVYPKTPTINSVTYNRTTNKISVKWARVAVCDYQQVAISTSPNFEPSKTCIYRVDQNKQSASFCKITFNGTQTTIKKGKTYYVRMRAYKTVNGTRIYGAYGAKRTIKCN